MLYFFTGIVFVILIYPCLSSIADIVLTALEIVKGKLTLKVTKINSELEKTQGPQSSSFAIGFTAPPDYSEFEEDDDEE